MELRHLPSFTRDNEGFMSIPILFMSFLSVSSLLKRYILNVSKYFSHLKTNHYSEWGCKKVSKNL